MIVVVIITICSRSSDVILIILIVMIVIMIITVCSRSSYVIVIILTIIVQASVGFHLLLLKVYNTHNVK